MAFSISRNNGLHRVQYELSRYDIEDISKSVANMSCQKLRANIFSRIGSFSEEAKAYKVFVDKYELAVKIPILHKSQEYQIGRKLTEEYPGYFLKTITNKWCDPKSFNDLMGYRYHEPEPLELIFMELAVGDLKQVIDDGINNLFLENYIADVFESVAIMAKKRKVHFDLHIRNVFIVVRHTTGCYSKSGGSDHCNNVYAVLGDFGKSKDAHYMTSNLDDLFTFFKDLRFYIFGDRENTDKCCHLNYLKDKIEYFRLNFLLPMYRYLEDYDIDESLETWDSNFVYDKIMELRDNWRSIPIPI